MRKNTVLASLLTAAGLIFMLFGFMALSASTPSADFFIPDEVEAPGPPVQPDATLPLPPLLGSGDATGPPPITPPITAEPDEPLPGEPLPETPLDPEPSERVIDPALPMVALTFDDGPHETVTDQILDILAMFDARATFFVIGKHVEGAPAPLKRAFDEGHEIASHTYGHKSLEKLKPSLMLNQLDEANRVIADVTGEGTALVRPPFGATSKLVMQTVPYPLIKWSIDPKDWQILNAQKVIDHVLERVQDGDIILLHDVYETTAEACITLVPELLDLGYQLVTVSELMEYKGVELTPGATYRHAR